MATSLARRAIALSLAAAAVSCGPVEATSLVRDAAAAGAKARAVQADRFAPYEMTAADLYLDKAREEQGRARYGVAQELARKSLQFADEAARKAAAQRGAAPAAPQPQPARGAPSAAPSSGAAGAQPEPPK